MSDVKIPLGWQLHIFACRQANRHRQSYEHQTETATERDRGKDRKKKKQAESETESSSLPEKGQSIAWLRKCVYFVCAAVHMTFNIVFILTQKRIHMYHMHVLWMFCIVYNPFWLSTFRIKYFAFFSFGKYGALDYILYYNIYNIHGKTMGQPKVMYTAHT